MNFTSPELDVLDLRLKVAGQGSPASSPRHPGSSFDFNKDESDRHHQQQQNARGEVHSDGASASSSRHEGSSEGTVVHLLEEGGMAVNLRGMGQTQSFEAGALAAEQEGGDEGSSSRSEQDHVAELGASGAQGLGSKTGQAFLQRASSGVAALTQDALGWHAK